MAAQRRESRLHRRQRRAELVAGVGREAPRRLQRALAVRARAAEPGEHRVEARGERASLGRAVLGRHATAEVLVAGDARRHAAQPRERAQHEPRRQPPPDPGDDQRQRAEGGESPVERVLARLERVEAGNNLQPGEPAELLVAQGCRIRAVVLAAGAEGVQPQREARALRRRRPGVEQHRLAEHEAQRAARRREDRVESAVVLGHLLLHGRQRGRPGELGGAPQAVVEGGALVVIDLARGNQPGNHQHGGEHQDDAEREPAAEAAHGRQPRMRVRPEGRSPRRGRCAAPAAHPRSRACGAGSRRRRRRCSCPGPRCSPRPPRAGARGRGPRRGGA